MLEAIGIIKYFKYCNSDLDSTHHYKCLRKNTRVWSRETRDNDVSIPHIIPFLYASDGMDKWNLFWKSGSGISLKMGLRHVKPGFSSYFAKFLPYLMIIQSGAYRGTMPWNRLGTPQKFKFKIRKMTNSASELGQWPKIIIKISQAGASVTYFFFHITLYKH